MSKLFHFKRIVQTEELYSVEMSDNMSNEDVAKSILVRALESGKPSEVVKLVSMIDIKKGKPTPCK